MSAKPLALIELHVRPVLAGYWVCIAEARHALGREFTPDERDALSAAERAEEEDEDYADAELILAELLETLEREFFEEHDLIAGVIPEQGAWVIAPPEYWEEGVDA